jgi:hypothetical protein
LTRLCISSTVKETIISSKFFHMTFLFIYLAILRIFKYKYGSIKHFFEEAPLWQLYILFGGTMVAVIADDLTGICLPTFFSIPIWVYRLTAVFLSGMCVYHYFYQESVVSCKDKCFCVQAHKGTDYFFFFGNILLCMTAGIMLCMHFVQPASPLCIFFTAILGIFAGILTCSIALCIGTAIGSHLSEKRSYFYRYAILL